jgi:4-amino-4-deoxy-L-arabinose transferase-like glycosyltransferase
MQTLVAWLLMGFVLLAGYPWAAWLLAKNPRDDGRWLTLLVGVSVSLGTLTLLMFWQAVIGIPLSLWAITIPYVALMLPGWLLWWRLRSVQSSQTQRRNPYSLLRRFTLFILILISAAILLNAVYWPFSRDDALRIYARYGRIMWSTGALVSFERDDSFYQTYPVLVPLAYTYTYLASGWQNEYLARVTPALLSLGCLPAVYILGRIIGGESVGGLSALLLALTPAFGSWASSGYVDLPMAFFYTLSAVFAWRLWHTRHWTDALLTGTMVGLAVWTKNAALLGVVIFASWLIWIRLTGRIQWRHVLLSMGACVLIAAPWYIRNLILARMLIAPTAWVAQARHTLDTLFIFASHFEIFGFPGWLLIVGIFASLIALLRRRNLPEITVLLWWAVPFFVAWWLFVSYDPRFLLMFLPLLTVMAAYWTVKIWSFIPHHWQQRAIIPLVVLALTLGLLAAWTNVEFKREMLRDPLMSDKAKHEIVLEE